MERQKGLITTSEAAALKSIGSLAVLRIELAQAGTLNERSQLSHSVYNAVSTLDFINNEITPKTEEFFEIRKPTKNIGFTPRFSLDFSRLFYSPNLKRLQIYIPGGTKDLSREFLERLWNEDISRYSVNLLANLTKQQILARFENYILQNK